VPIFSPKIDKKMFITLAPCQKISRKIGPGAPGPIFRLIFINVFIAATIATVHPLTSRQTVENILSRDRKIYFFQKMITHSIIPKSALVF
jgi:hypothetical protein